MNKFDIWKKLMHKNAINMLEGVKKILLWRIFERNLAKFFCGAFLSTFWPNSSVAHFWAHFGQIVAHFDANLLVTLETYKKKIWKRRKNGSSISWTFWRLKAFFMCTMRYFFNKQSRIDLHKIHRSYWSSLFIQ